MHLPSKSTESQLKHPCIPWQNTACQRRCVGAMHGRPQGRGACLAEVHQSLPCIEAVLNRPADLYSARSDAFEGVAVGMVGSGIQQKCHIQAWQVPMLLAGEQAVV